MPWGLCEIAHIPFVPCHVPCRVPPRVLLHPHIAAHKPLLYLAVFPNPDTLPYRILPSLHSSLPAHCVPAASILQGSSQQTYGWLSSVGSSSPGGMDDHDTHGHLPVLGAWMITIHMAIFQFSSPTLILPICSCGQRASINVFSSMRSINVRLATTHACTNRPCHPR